MPTPPICRGCRERPGHTTLEMIAGTRARTVRGERLVPAEPAQTYPLRSDCAEDIWAQIATVDLEIFSSNSPHPLKFETSKGRAPLEGDAARRDSDRR